MPDLLLRSGCPWGAGASADVVIREGVIERIGPELRADPAAEVVDVPGRRLLPGLIDAHCYVDKTLFGGRWVPHLAGPALADRIAEERRRRADLAIRSSAAYAFAAPDRRAPHPASRVVADTAGQAGPLPFVAQAVSGPYQRHFSPECDVSRSNRWCAAVKRCHRTS